MVNICVYSIPHIKYFHIGKRLERRNLPSSSSHRHLRSSSFAIISQPRRGRPLIGGHSMANITARPGKTLQDGAPKIAKLPYFSGFMVDITIVLIGVIMVYKPTYNWGAPRPYGLPGFPVRKTSCLGASLNPGQSCTDKELGWQRVGLQCWVKRLGGANTLWRMILRLRFGLKRGRKYFAASNSFAHSSSCSPTVKQTGPEKTFDYIKWLNLT